LGEGGFVFGKKNIVFGGNRILSLGELKLTDNKKELFFGEKKILSLGEIGFCLWGIKIN